MTDLVPKRKLVIKQGGTRTLTYRILDNNGTPKDLSGYTAKLEIRANPGGDLICSLTSSSGITINSAAGEVVPLWSATTTGAFNFEKAVYDCYVAKAGDVTYIIEGEVELIPRVSQ